jgi:hypothetical protein
MGELADAIVTEQVGIGEHGDPAGAVSGDGGERRIRLGGRVVGAGEHGGAVDRRENAGPVEAGAADAGEQIGRGPAVGGRGRGTVEGGENPGGSLAVMVGVVLDGRVLDPEAEAGEEVVEVVAVLLLLGLAERDQPPAGGDEPLDRIELGGGEAGGAGVNGRLPAGVGGVGDDEHGDALERRGRERAAHVDGDLELARGEGAGGVGERRIAGVSGLDRGGDVGAHCPGLGVGLVEDDGGELRVGGVHGGHQR